MEEFLEQIRKKYPFVEIYAYEFQSHIELTNIQIPKERRGFGIGTNIIRMLQKYATNVGKPIVLRPESEPRKKGALNRFYKKLDFIHNKGRHIDYALSSPTAKTMYWRFKEWLTVAEAKFDPKITNLQVYKNFENKPYLDRSFSLSIDKKGNVVPYDYKSNKPHLILTSDKRVQLQKLGPQSKEFRQIINALRNKYPDIDQYPVEHYFQAGHMQGGNGRYRTVSYWMKKPEIRLANKIPKYFYHGTSTNLWYEGIKEKGLIPRQFTGSTGSYGSQNIDSLSHDDLVYLATDPDAATREAAAQAAKKYGGSPMIIRIKTIGLDPNRLAPDEDTKSVTAQGSIDVASTLAYRGRIPSSNLEPFLLGQRLTIKGINQTNWKKFEDVPFTEHPLTTKLKKGELPFIDDPEYYALLDAGIIGEDKASNKSGIIILDKNITDDKIRTILKKSGWTQNVKAIIRDINSGYQGSIYQLEGIAIPVDALKNKYIQILLESELAKAQKYGDDKFVINIRTWNIEFYAIKLAKLIGKMSFSKFASEIKKFIEQYKI